MQGMGCPFWGHFRTHAPQQGKPYSITSQARPASFGQPRFPKALNEQLCVCLSAPGDKRRYCKGGIDLKHTRRRVVCLSVTFEMGEGGREAAISCHIELLTKGFPRYADRLVKATKLNKGHPNASKRHVQPRVHRAHANGEFKTPDRFLRQPRNSIDLASAVPCVK